MQSSRDKIEFLLDVCIAAMNIHILTLMLFILSLI